MKTTRVGTVILRKPASHPESVIRLAELTAIEGRSGEVAEPFEAAGAQASAREVGDRSKGPTRVRAHGLLLDESFERDIVEMEAGHRSEAFVLIVLACCGLGGLAACAMSVWRYFQ